MKKKKIEKEKHEKEKHEKETIDKEKIEKEKIEKEKHEKEKLEKEIHDNKKVETSKVELPITEIQNKSDKSKVLYEYFSTPKGKEKLILAQAVCRGYLVRLKIKHEKQERTRRDIVAEITLTETLYVNNLSKLISVYIEPIKKNPDYFALMENMKTVFSEVEVIRGYNGLILADLKSEKKSIGKIFLAICDFLKVYTVYVNNYSVSFDTLRIAMTNKHFQAFLEKQKLSPESNQLDFASFLIMPIQRIPRYVLLLQDLFKHTRKSHPDYVSLKKVLWKK